MPMYDTTALLSAGVPQSKSMIKYGNSVDQNGNVVMIDLQKLNLKYDSAVAMFREQNKIETLERYQWINVPFGLTQDLIERVLFYRGKGVFYYNDNVDKFQFLPFALNGNIDEYGRYLKCNTLPFTGVDDDWNKDTKKKKDNKTKQQPLIYQDLEIVYDLPYNKETLEKASKLKTVGIILNDSSLGISQQPTIRSNYVKPVIHLMATLMQIINTAMFGCADHSLITVESETQLQSINLQIDAINQDIMKGKRFTPVVSPVPITPLKTNNTANLEGLFNTFNSLNNLLKSITGIANAGIFDKKAHLLQEEQDLNGSNADDIYYNGLRLRQEFCLMIQAYYNYPIWCESKRALTTAQKENVLEGETDNPDNTQQMIKEGE